VRAALARVLVATTFVATGLTSPSPLGSSLLGSSLAATVPGPGLSAALLGSAAAPFNTTTSPIRHVVEIMLENHTFDNLFAGLRGADGAPPGTNFPSPTVPGARVGLLEAGANQGSVGPNLDNSRLGEIAAMDRQGPGTFRMDRYTVTPYEGLASVTVFPPSIDPNLQFLATHYALAEANFQPEIAPTLPNVLAAVAGGSDGWYSNDNPPASDRFRTIFDELQAAGLSWDIFYGVSPALLAGSVWDQLMPAGHTRDLVGADQFMGDAGAGDLPDFSFVRPGYGYSEESPEDTSLGDAWLGQLVLAVMRGPDWPSTAIFVTYDEGGGFWDHVSPPQVDAAGYGTRTPMVVISPYTAPLFIKETTTNLSVLSFVQKLWHLAPLGVTNSRAPNLLNYFDFDQPPRPPEVPPAAPPATLNLQVAGPGSIYYTAPLDQPVKITLAAETPGLAPDVALSGPVALSVKGPTGAPAAGVPATALLKAGSGWFEARFPADGYWRVKAVGPERSLGWMTIGVAVNANTP
jgi:phospholipase C